MAREQCADRVNDWYILLQQMGRHVLDDRELLQSYRQKKYYKHCGEGVGGTHAAGGQRLEVWRLG